MRTIVPLLLLLPLACAEGPLEDSDEAERAGFGKADDTSDGGAVAPSADVAGAWRAQIISTVRSRSLDDPDDKPVISVTTIEGAVDVAQAEGKASVTLQPCEVTLPEIEERQPVLAFAALVGAGPLALEGSVKDGQLVTEGGVLVLGAALADPGGEALPVEDDDPRLVDHDGDGRPGVTVSLGSFSIYAAVRVTVALDGLVTESEVVGTATLDLDFEVLGDDIPFVNARRRTEAAAAETEVLEATAEFRLSRVDAVSCAAP